MRELKQIRNIHCVPYVHADHAWTNSRQWHIKRYVEGMVRVLDYMKENPDYTFMIDNVLHYYAVIERFLPERVEEIRQRVREGRICIVNGGMALARPYNYGDELYLRNVVEGRKALQERFPEAEIFLFLNADTGVGHSQMPQLLAKTGHKHYRFFRPENALDHSGVPREFIWKGLDGTAIVATRGYYGSFLEGDCCDERHTSWDEKKAAFVKEELEGRLPYTETEELFLNIGSDDTYPQRNVCDNEADITEFMREWNAHEPSRMFYSTPRAYHDAVTAKPLPVWEGPCDPVDLFYNSPVRSQLALTRLRFETERLLLQAERLQVILTELGGTVEEETLTRLWELLFTFSGHAMQSLLKEDYQEMLERAGLAICKARLYVRELLLQIAHQAGSDRPNTYVLINPEPYARWETVELLITTPEHVRGLRLYDQDGQALEYQILDGYEGDKPYVNKDYNELLLACTVKLPPLGIRRIYAENSQASILNQADHQIFLWSEPLNPKGPILLDNGRYCFTIRDGAVCRIEDSLDTADCGKMASDCQRTGKDIKKMDCFGQLRFYKTDVQIASESTWSTWEQGDVRTFCPEGVKYLQRGPEQWRLVITGTLNGLEASVTISTKKHSPTLHYEVHFDCRGDEGYFAMAFDCSETPEILAGIPFGAEQRELTKVGYSEDFQIPKDDYLYYERGCKGGFCANRFVSFAMDGKRILLTQDDTAYLYRHKEAEQEIETFFMRSVDMKPREKLWLRNAHDSQTGIGRHDFSFTVSVLDGNATISQQERIVSRNRFPVLSTPLYDVPPFPVSAWESAFQEFPENLTVTACYVQGDHVVLRMYENSGKGWRGRIKLGLAVKAVERCDFMGNVLESVAVCEGTLDLAVQPWEIVTLKLTKQASP